MRFLSIIASLFWTINLCYAQIPDHPNDEWGGIPVNYTEDKVPAYTLEDPLLMKDGSSVASVQDWFEKRRPELIALFEEHQFGKTPDISPELNYVTNEAHILAFGGKAVRKRVTVYFTSDLKGPAMELLIYTPPDASGPVPLLLNISFSANRATTGDPDIPFGFVWNNDRIRVPATDEARFGQLDVLPFIEAGFGVATVYYGDIEPDFEGGEVFGIRKHLVDPQMQERPSSDWGAVAAWAWGLSRAMDYFEKDRDLDETRVAVSGFSRLGKAAVWAVARDQRFAMALPSCSGQGGAAISRREYGETIKLITHPDRFDYWFAPRYAEWGEDPGQSPVDAHLLLALIAPRPLLLQTGNTDKWSDPKGEFDAAVAVSPAYQFLGAEGLGISDVPETGNPVFGTIGFYMHEGGHGTYPEDWAQFLAFMKKHLL